MLEQPFSILRAEQPSRDKVMHNFRHGHNVYARFRRQLIIRPDVCHEVLLSRRRAAPVSEECAGGSRTIQGIALSIEAHRYTAHP